MLTCRIYFSIEITGSNYAFFLVHDMLNFSPFEKHLALKFVLILRMLDKKVRESQTISLSGKTFDLFKKSGYGLLWLKSVE